MDRRIPKRKPLDATLTGRDFRCVGIFSLQNAERDLTQAAGDCQLGAVPFQRPSFVSTHMNLDSTTPLFSSRIRQAAGLAAGVALASSATAAIFDIDIHVGTTEIGVDPFTADTGLGYPAAYELPFLFYNSYGSYYEFGSGGNGDWLESGYEAVILEFNDPIGGEGSYRAWVGLDFEEGISIDSLYLGFRYDNGDGYQYGWLHGSYSSDTGLHFDQIAVNPVVGETAYAGMYAAAVPEPATSALLFGLVAAGVLFWRRRRSRLLAAA